MELKEYIFRLYFTHSTRLCLCKLLTLERATLLFLYSPKDSVAKFRQIFSKYWHPSCEYGIHMQKTVRPLLRNHRPPCTLKQPRFPEVTQGNGDATRWTCMGESGLPGESLGNSFCRRQVGRGPSARVWVAHGCREG